jgi:DNA invertase Pin-like site-specific DNA recombinase
MAAIAEFYSDNLGQEVRKGMQQKLRNGGWPNLAPVGYLKVRVNGERSRKLFWRSIRNRRPSWQMRSSCTQRVSLRCRH